MSAAVFEDRLAAVAGLYGVVLVEELAVLEFLLLCGVVS